MSLIFRVFVASYPFLVKRHHLARLHVSDELGSNKVEGAGLAAYQKRISKTAQGQRLDAMLVTCCVYAVLGTYEEGKTSLHHVEGFENIGNPVLAVMFLNEVAKQLGISAGLEKAALILQIQPQSVSIYYAALAGNGKVTLVLVEKQGLYIAKTSFGLVCILSGSYAHISAHAAEQLLIEYVADQRKATVMMAAAVCFKAGDAGPLLSSVLEGMQTQVYYLCGFLAAVYSENTHSPILSSLSITSR